MAELSPDALRLLRAIGESGRKGLTLKQQSAVFSGHRTAEQLAAMRAPLLQQRLIEERVFRPEGRGRPTTKHRARLSK